jgi:Domain of unknown function (DUF4381)
MVVAVFLGAAGHLSAQAPDAAEDIRDAKPLVEIPVPGKPPYEFWLGVGGGILLVGVVWFIWRHFRGKQKAKSPREVAMRSLTELEVKTDTLTAEAFAYQSSKVVRQYIAGRFGLAAPCRTTEEFLRDLARDETSPLAGQGDHLKMFLKSCDLAKFAGSNLDTIQRVELLQAARGFIQATSATP